MNKKVVVDLDGVLADFEGAFCKKFGYDRRELVSLESRYPKQAREIDKFLNDGFVYKNLKPIQLGLDIVQYLNDYDYEVHIVTARPFGLESVTREWLKRHRVNFWSVQSNRAKTGLIASMRPLCAVDDFFSVHEALLTWNVPVILVAQPWNRYSGENLRRISNLSEFVTHFKKLL